MKKILVFMLSIIVVFFISFKSFNLFHKSTSVGQKDISNKIIRFHVLANSDSIEDQSLKLKVKDEIIKYMMPKLDKSSSIDESRKILKENDKEIKKIAENIINKNGYKYSINTYLGQDLFPIKTYGNITLPQGKYEAYKIVIGNGQGQNWWCVMFPPLCFVDVTKGEVSTKKTEQKMKKVLKEEELKCINNSKNSYEIKFKVVEKINKLKR
ncbi:stage II sporulation protein R [Clostridium botulinum]|uniref:Stage II sporulation protein R n=1 Tax=Clostridium botulinum (strain Langeland / NCTC 10281 / Type F) TaxID=441772 RepID=A7G9M9_CLOBL|nr:stage II sporulation protein R [Clostridium botulinum]ABS40367.1 stage II sporulation protein R [Clostridium botulinum F str. Langeland]ADF97967.1 stage II sporulation protein R [Clostridium botulinum F str. 230613]KKM41679.1 peptidase [Clostridium botulinum]MBY6792861.1 stage II sporulation protein R [Clostridium botulinum]MBY6938508.1 stage II sporulation protein R [Clostridium botulinum]